MSSSRKVRVRFAPSPTGLLHIGGARTALFNWFFAKANGGEFVLRMEDTDKERSMREFEKDIKDSLAWLGITWDEIYRQSEREEIYKKYLENLLKDNWIYHCFCTKEDLETQRQAMLSQGLAPRYSGICRTRKISEIEKKLKNGDNYVLRFKVRETKIEFEDLIRGKITFDTSLIGDFVVARGLNSPLYNFAVVIDDALTEITHVIRGEEHISNTPRQILLANALNLDIPQFAHLPIILNADRSKMSKRFTDTALSYYIKQGYIREALINFMAYLGWHPKENKDIMNVDEIINEFELGRVGKGGAIFNIDKLEWLNSQYIQSMAPEKFIVLAKAFLPDEWKLTPRMAESTKTRVKKLSDVKGLVDFYFELPNYSADMLLWKDNNLKDTVGNLRKIYKLIESMQENKFKALPLEGFIMPKLPEGGRGDILWPLRVSLSGKKKSPSPFEIMEVLEKKESLKRIYIAIEKAHIHGT